MTDFIYFNNWHQDQPSTRFEEALSRTKLNVRVYRTQSGEFPGPEAIASAKGAFVSASVSGAYDGDVWIDALGDALRGLANRRIPMLGLCFGSQVLAWALLGKDQVFKRADRETGYADIELTAAGREDELTRGFAPTVRTFLWHGDEVRSDHPDAVILARNDACANQIWRWKHGPVWGIQPHPEMDRAQICRFIAQNRDWFAAEGKDADALIRCAEPNDQLSPILDRFLDLCRSTIAAD